MLGLIGLSSSAVSVVGASAAGKPKVVVTPSTNLKNGESVSVAGSGFKPGDTVFIVECLVKAKGEAGCLVKGIPTSLTISATGKLPRSKIKVVEGKIGNGKCGTTKANLKACAVSVGNDLGGDSGVGDITFKAPLK
jgi:uncharacterized low-complexity protein